MTVESRKIFSKIIYNEVTVIKEEWQRFESLPANLIAHPGYPTIL